MNVVLLSVAALLAAIAIFLFKRNAKDKTAQRRLPPRTARLARPERLASDRADARSVPLSPVELVPPAELAAFVLQPSESLAEARLAELLGELRRVPQPPRALHQLISPDFVGKASSTELSELIMGEPLVAARIIVRVNSPLYGLQQPVTGIGQAVTYLGLNSVRAICLQYMLNESFSASSPALRQQFEAIWRASACASELCARLASTLQLPDAGGLLTRLVLSFLGQFATAALMQRHAGGLPSRPVSLLERAQAEQQVLGLSSSEIGFLLMQEWNVPASITAEVRAIDRVLVTPVQAMDERLGLAAALGFCCARLGERLAAGTLGDPANWDLRAQTEPDFFHLQGYLSLPGLARLPELLKAPDMLRSIKAMSSR